MHDTFQWANHLQTNGNQLSLTELLVSNQGVIWRTSGRAGGGQKNLAVVVLNVTVTDTRTAEII